MMDKNPEKKPNGRLFAEFPPVDVAQWEETIREDLKGADYEKKLIWKSPEGIAVKPYYTQEDLKDVLAAPVFPGQFPFTRGNKAGDNAWYIRQDIQVEAGKTEAANRKAHEILQKGADSIGFRIPDSVNLSYEDFGELMQNIWVKGIEVNFDAGHQAISIARYLRRLMDERNRDYARLHGSLNFDPIGYLTQHGNYCPSCGDADGAFAQAHELMKEAAGLTNLRAITVNGSIFGNAGATIVQELAFSLSEGVEYLTQLTSKGLSVSALAPRLRFVFSIGSNYFFEIARLRAARLLWAHIVKAYGPVSEEICRMNIHSVTSSFNKTLYDPYVNLLRTTTEAMAAAIGGTDSMEVLTFDMPAGTSSPLGERMARNQQLILKEEAGFDKVNDPAAGSYYIETLTESIAHEAWALFLKTEEKGGYLEALKAGDIQSQIARSAIQRENAVASRRETILGTNQYPNTTEYINQPLDETLISKHSPSDAGTIVQPISPYRAGMAMEALRYRTDRYALNHKRPAVLPLLIGSVTMRQARAQFTGNFFGCAGFSILPGKSVASAAEGIQAALDSEAEIITICSSDEEYAVVAPEIHQGLKDKTLVVVAGNPACTDELKSLGLTRFIHVRSNLLETLLQYQKDLNIV
jgi:methylmalonyl-CoA mutase